MHATPHGSSIGYTARAFSLIELITIISIIGVLAMLLIPSLEFTRNSARATQNQSNLRQIYAAAMLWSQDNENYILPVYWPNEQPKDPFSPRHWPSLIAPYLGRISEENMTSFNDLPMLISPFAPDTFGYGHNYWGCSPWTGPQEGTNAILRRVKLQNAIDPGRTVFFTDVHVNNPSQWRTYVRPPSMGGWDAMPQADYTMAFRNPGETCHALWLDGHISAESKDSAFARDNTLWGGSNR